MLLLARKQQQTIVLRSPTGETATFTVAKIKGNSTVRLAIEAPDDWKILRGELLEESGVETLPVPLAAKGA